MRTLAQHARATVALSNVTPTWLLIFLRLAGGRHGDYAKAWKMLPDHLPGTVSCPTMFECAATLAHHRLS